MLSRLAGLATAGATLAYQVWQTLWALVFDVEINVPVTDIALTAGQRQHICTVEISIPENYNLGNPQEPIEFPRPSFYLLLKDNLATNNRSLTFSETTHGRRELTIDVFAHLTVSGNYSVHPQFPVASRINIIAGRNYATFLVHPSKPESLTLRKIRPARGDGRGSSVYRGGKAEIFIEAKDVYSNIVVDNIVFIINSSHVTLNSCSFDSENDCHVVIADCEKEGLASLSFTCTYNRSEVLHTNANLNIIPAPLYPTNCQLAKNVSPVVAGRVIKWKLQLYDIYNHPFPLKESSENVKRIVMKIGGKTKPHDKNWQKEGSSLNVSLSGTHICYLEWQPLIAGSRSVTVSIDGIQVGSLQITVEPGPLVSLRIISHNHPSAVLYSKQWRSVSVVGLDAYGNRVLLDPQQWCLKARGCGLHQGSRLAASDKNILECSYSFDEHGAYMVQMKSVDDTLNYIKVPDSFSVEVASPPLDPKRCAVINTEENVVVAGQSFRLKLSLVDIFGNYLALKELNDEIVDSICLKTLDQNSSENTKDKEMCKVILTDDVDLSVCYLEWQPQVAGNRSITISIDGIQVRKCPLTVTVEPGPLVSLRIISHNHPSAVLYTNQWRSVSVVGLDAYGNRVLLDPQQWCLKARGCGLHQGARLAASDKTILECSYSFDEHGAYMVQVKSVDDTLNYIKVPESFSVEVASPPLNPKRCAVINTDDNVAVAGQSFRLKLSLVDIFGNPLALKEIKDEIVDRIRLKTLDRNSSENTKNKEMFKVILPDDVDLSVCYLEWQPLVAGNRSISISIDGIEVENGPLQVTVQPGPLMSIKPVSQMPSADNQIVCNPTQELNVCFKGFDEFENTVPIDSMQWYMEVSTNGGERLSQKINATSLHRTTALQFLYSFDKIGTYHLCIKSLDILGKVQLPDSFAVKVVSAPLDPTNCRVSLDKPIFATTHSKLTVKLALLDCMSKPYCYTKLERSLIKMKVNGEFSNTHLAPIDATNTSEVYLSTNTNIPDNTECSVEIEYNGQLVGCPICEDVVYIHPYRKGEYLYPDSSLQLACKKIPHWKLTGDDGVNVDNINRVLDTTFPELNERIDYNDIQRDDQDSVVRFQLLKFKIVGVTPYTVIIKFSELVSLLVESIHYRDQANKFNESREEWKAKAMDAYNSTMHDEARECSSIKEKYAKLMNECHRKASDAIFHFYNYGRSESEIDLHGQLVANECELREYRNQLLRKKDKTEVKRIIEKERNEMDEAIRRLGNINVGETREGRDWLEIIVGAGHHSRDQRQKVRPKVEQFLNERNIRFIESNKGALLITYREYNGREPCYATFYCKKCNKDWKSHTSWKGMWQKCFRCDKKRKDSKCYPFKLRSASTSSRRTNYRGASSMVFTHEDHVRLCQKCQESGGRYCSKL